MRYPRISLTGSFGFASSELDELLDGDSENWNIFAGLLQPIFNAGRNKRRVEVRQSQQRQPCTSTRTRCCARCGRSRTRSSACRSRASSAARRAQRVGAERRVLELAEVRYRGGVAGYLEVLDAQRSLFDAEIDETSSISEHVLSLIRLYKALGGGWPVVEETTEETSTEARLSR